MVAIEGSTSPTKSPLVPTELNGTYRLEKVNSDRLMKITGRTMA